MIYAVIDTNVLVSALLSKYPDSATVKVVELVSENGIRPLYNQEILTEYKDVLNRTKFKFPPHLVEAILNLIQEIGVKCDRANEPLTSFSDFGTSVRERSATPACSKRRTRDICRH